MVERMESPSIIFMGTPEFAVPSLKLLHETYGIKAVVSVPDKPAGRGRKLQSTPVSTCAKELGIRLFTPDRLKDPEFITQIAELKPDIIVVIAFRILPREVYSLGKLGAFNIHGSLLPKYRGAAPIQWAIINGEKETGLTSFLLNDSVDTGKIIEQFHFDIPSEMTSGELFEALKIPAARLSVSTCKALLESDIIPKPQDDALATPAPKLFRDQCKIDWTKSCKAIHDLIRGTNPKPGAWTIFHEASLKILASQCFDSPLDLQPGQYRITDTAFLVGTGDGMISLLKIQEEGRQAIAISDFLRGYRHAREGQFT
jgi:methionyl-tRNA formyltransferase